MPKLSELSALSKIFSATVKTPIVYRSTLIECGYSQAEFLMNRQLCSTVPIPHSQLKPYIHINTLP